MKTLISYLMIASFVITTQAAVPAKKSNGERLSLRDPFPGAGRTQGAGINRTNAVDNDPPTGYLQTWNFTIEKDLGGGNVLAAVCDLTIAGEAATFGQVGPGMGSVDPGFGTAYLARLVGEKKAREMWYLCRRYSAAEALAMGLVNAVVPDAELDAEVARWCAEITGKSPTAIALAKSSIHADSDHIAGIANLGFNALKLYLGTDESREGGEAFRDKRKPDFRKHLK